MTALVKMTYSDVDLDAVAALGGLIAIFVGADGVANGGEGGLYVL